jgi:hypothetical protein
VRGGRFEALFQDTLFGSLGGMCLLAPRRAAKWEELWVGVQGGSRGALKATLFRTYGPPFEGLVAYCVRSGGNPVPRF